jgi:hypothetical protein
MPDRGSCSHIPRPVPFSTVWKRFSIGALTIYFKKQLWNRRKLAVPLHARRTAFARPGPRYRRLIHPTSPMHKRVSSKQDIFPHIDTGGFAWNLPSGRGQAPSWHTPRAVLRPRRYAHPFARQATRPALRIGQIALQRIHDRNREHRDHSFQPTRAAPGG